MGQRGPMQTQGGPRHATSALGGSSGARRQQERSSSNVPHALNQALPRSPNGTGREGRGEVRPPLVQRCTFKSVKMRRVGLVVAVLATGQLLGTSAVTQISAATTLFGHAIKNGPLPPNNEVCVCGRGFCDGGILGF